MGVLAGPGRGWHAARRSMAHPLLLAKNAFPATQPTAMLYLPGEMPEDMKPGWPRSTP